METSERFAGFVASFDFVVIGAGIVVPSSAHVLNAISPAFTSVFAFSELFVGRYIATSVIAHVA